MTGSIPYRSGVGEVNKVMPLHLGWERTQLTLTAPVLPVIAIPVGLATVPILEAANPFANSMEIRRYVPRPRRYYTVQREHRVMLREMLPVEHAPARHKTYVDGLMVSLEHPG